MKLDLNEEQRMLRESAVAWLAKEYTHPQWREIAGNGGFSSEVWKEFADMGWLAASLAEQHGGLGGGAAESFVLGEAFGSALVLEPYLSTVVLGAGLIQYAGTPAQAHEYLPQVAEGRIKLAFAYAERQSRYSLRDVHTRAEQQSGRWVLHGHKTVVWDAPNADLLLVWARTGGAATDHDGCALFLVDPHGAGARMEIFPLIDQRPAAQMHLDKVAAVARLGDGDCPAATVQRALDEAFAYLAAEATGAMAAATALSVGYMQERKQFGQTLSTFQVLRHRVVDMQVQTECARSLALHAAQCAAARHTDLSRAAAAAKMYAGRHGRQVGEAAVHIHGGMGMTDEMAVGHYLRRLATIDLGFGNADHQLAAFARLSAAR